MPWTILLSQIVQTLQSLLIMPRWEWGSLHSLIYSLSTGLLHIPACPWLLPEKVPPQMARLLAEICLASSPHHDLPWAAGTSPLNLEPGPGHNVPQVGFHQKYATLNWIFGVSWQKIFWGCWERALDCPISLLTSEYFLRVSHPRSSNGATTHSFCCTYKLNMPQKAITLRTLVVGNAHWWRDGCNKTMKLELNINNFVSCSH